MRYIVALSLYFLCAVVHADSWAPAKVQATVSPDGNIVVRVIPGSSLGDVYGYAGEKKGQFAQAIYYRLLGGENYIRYQQTVLLNPVAPVDIAVSNSGELVTLDNWHNMGIGKVVAIYAADGSVRRSYELKEIYPMEELKKIDRSVSSLWWRCGRPLVVESRTSSVGILDTLGNVIEVNLATGKLTKTAHHKGCQ